MEKFGEWKHAHRVHEWNNNGQASWEITILKSGYYKVDLTYAGTGRLTWKVAIENGGTIQNQQNASHNFQAFPIGWIHFPEPEPYKVKVSCIEGDAKEASLKSIHFTRVEL